MVETTLTKPITMDDLLERLAIDKRVEVVNGMFKESDPMTAGYLHLHIVGNLSDALKPHIRKHNLGLFGSDGLTCVLHVDDDGVRTTRIPDTFFLKTENIPAGWNIAKPLPTAPDLAIEVVSPNEKPDDLQAKIDDYLIYGTSEVWVLYPTNKTLYRYRAEELSVVRIYREGETFQTEDLLSDLVINIDDLFRVELPHQSNG